MKSMNVQQEKQWTFYGVNDIVPVILWVLY
jgi:hypothetical protein